MLGSHELVGDLMTLSVEFCGESHVVGPSTVFTIGREGDLSVDDNPFLHRQFLTLDPSAIPLLSNVGSRLSATVSEPESVLEAFLGPGSVLPIVFSRTCVAFTAGTTTYELFIVNDAPSFATTAPISDSVGDTTLGPAHLTPDQRLLIIAIAEPSLSRSGRVGAVIPSSSEAAERLGWTLTKFNRKLDNVCQKLAKLGVNGLHGRPGELASGRRSRLVEYAISTRMVTRADLTLLPPRVKGIR